MEKQVVISTTKTVGPFFRTEKYRNTSLRFAPPPWVSEYAAKQFGVPSIVRIFITLDEFWDYRDDSYHPNYQIGCNRYDDNDSIHWYDRHRSKASDVHFMDYLKSVSANSEELLLCFRRYEHEVMNGTITPQQYSHVLKQAIHHCKTHAPNLRYIEVLNEWGCAHFGGLDDTNYYTIYQMTYAIINELNRENRYDLPLLIGGPATATAHFGAIEKFLEQYAIDSNPDKKLDFISFHDYSNGDSPVRVHNLRQQLDHWLQKNSLPRNIRTFVTEIGTREGRQFEDKRSANLFNTAGVLSLLQHFSRCHDTIAFPWCQYHDPQIQPWSTQILPDGSLTSHGSAMKMLSFHKNTALHVKADTIDKNGLGLYVIASSDTSDIVVQAWNYGKNPVQSSIIVGPLKKRPLRIREYRIDTVHSQNDLECVREYQKESCTSLTFRLEFQPLAIWCADITENG